jgi:hypothetical protein
MRQNELARDSVKHLVWPIMRKHAMAEEQAKSMNAEELAVSQEGCWRKIAITLTTPEQPALGESSPGS